MELVKPAREHLASYTAALEQGWSPDNTRPQAGHEQLEKIKQDPDTFLASMDDREAKGGPVTLPDGSKVTRLPSFRRWLWDGEFCGSIGLRWQPGTEDLPPHCLGHIGYAVPAWKRRRGCAKFMLAGMLPEARAVGLRYIDITTDLDNTPSQKVITANGGVLVKEFVKGPEYGHAPGLLYRIAL